MCVKGGSKMKTKLTERKGAKGLIIALLLAVIMITGMVIPSYATVNGPGFTWNHGDYSSRVRWEARYALSRSANGTSTNPYGNSWFGDWDYVASDSYAYNRAAAEAGWVVGGIATNTGISPARYRGGWCTFFVRLILFRSTYWTGYGQHLTTPAFPEQVYAHVDGNYMTDRYDTVQPGWIFVTAVNQHYAVADERANVNGSWGWWFIDANYVGGNGNFYIARHFMSDATLRANSYRAWRPDRATNN